jgi:hypothetical protein
MFTIDTLTILQNLSWEKINLCVRVNMHARVCVSDVFRVIFRGRNIYSLITLDITYV